MGFHKGPLCRGCGCALTSNNDSEAHIIPNALGGRLKPKGILCAACNTELDKLADNPLVEAFGAWPTLLDLPRDRGRNPPKTVVSETGLRVRVGIEGPYTVQDVQYEKQPLAGGATKVSISAPTEQIARQLAGRVAKEFPGVDVEDVMRLKRTESLPKDERINAAVNFGTAAVLGGVSAALWLFALWKEGRAPLSWEELKQDIAERQGGNGRLRHLVNGLPGLEGPVVPFGHKIVMRSVPRTRELIAYVEILGLLRIGGVYGVAKAGPVSRVEHIYVYDLDHQRDRSTEFCINPTVFDGQDSSTVGFASGERDRLVSYCQRAITDVLEPRYRTRPPPAIEPTPRDD
jgi:hypothetical protein